jgi:hypothetical protein
MSRTVCRLRPAFWASEKPLTTRYSELHAGLEGEADALLCWHICQVTVGLIGLAFYLRGLGRTVKAANSY